MPTYDDNKPFALDSEGRIVKADPLFDILNSPSQSPTNVPGSSPQEAAANAFTGPETTPSTTPTIKKTTTSAAPATKQATIWNPNTGEKKVINVGEAVPKGWSVWTGGTATGQQAREAIWANQKSAGAAGAEGGALEGDVMSKEDMAAGAFDEGGTDQGTTEPDTTTSQPAEEKWQTPTIDSILEGFGIEKIKTSDFTSEYENLKAWQDNQLEAIDIKYEQEFLDQEQKNQNATAALQAKLIKAGVSIDGTSYESAVAGQESRNAQEMRKLERLKSQEQAAVRNGYYTNYLSLSKQERDEAFNVMTTNINNFFKGYDLATNIWEAFNKRSADQQAAEQSAQEHLDKMMLEWAKLDNNQRADNLNILETFVKDGLYDVYNEDVAKMLYKLEDLNGLEPGTLVDAAVGGYWDRMSNISLKEAQTEQMLASAEKTRATLPLTLEQMQADLDKTRTQIAKTRQDMAASANGLSSDEKAFFSDVENGLDDLAKGRLWGEVWNRIAIKHGIDPTSDSAEDKDQVALLDRLLNKDYWFDNGIEDLKKSKRSEELSDKEFSFLQFDPESGQLITEN